METQRTKQIMSVDGDYFISIAMINNDCTQIIDVEHKRIMAWALIEKNDINDNGKVNEYPTDTLIVPLIKGDFGCELTQLAPSEETLIVGWGKDKVTLCDAQRFAIRNTHFLSDWKNYKESWKQ